MANLKPTQTKHWVALLAALFVIVLIAHLAALDAARGQFSINKSVQTTALTTRMIELPAVVPVVQKPPDIETPRKPPNPPKALPKIVKPKPAPTLRPIPAETAVALVAPPVPPDPAAQVVPPALPPPAVETATPAPEPVQPTPTTAAEAGAPPPAFTAMSSGQHAYKVIFTRSGNSNQGQAEMRWQQNGEKYALSLTASFLFADVFAFKSNGLLSPSGLQPERFSDKRYRRSEVAAHFDRTSGKITFSVNTPDALLQDSAQDRVSIFWQLAGMLVADPARYPPGKTFTLQTVSATDAEPWLFTVNEPETLNLPTGSQIALRLTRNPRREFDQKVEMWFATNMNYLPVRFRFTETNGDYVDALWQSAQPLPAVLP
jgi:hypothetical protein